VNDASGRPARGDAVRDRHRAHSAVSTTLAILRKELLDNFRDRRTGVVTMLSAILAGPIFLLLIFNLIASQAERARDLRLPVVGAEYAPAVVAFLERQQVTLPKAPDDYDAQIRRGDLDVVLVIDERFAGEVAQGRREACASCSIGRAIARGRRSIKPRRCFAATTGCGASSD